ERPTPSSKPSHAASTAHPNMNHTVGSTEANIHSAVAINSQPKICLTVFIHAPALGISTPDVAPTSSKSTPDPHAMANSAIAPIAMLPVCEMNSCTPARGAATQGPTISAESIPIKNTPL